MKKITLLLISMFCAVSSIPLFAQTISAPITYGPTPNERQFKYLKNPMAAFIHFGMNTFAGHDGIEWGNDVKRAPTTFNPIGGKIDTDQWVRLLKKAGFTRVIITLKHHDGFCLWPTKITDYNISHSSYLNGKGDLAKELSNSCDKYGMDMGIYLSPWDAWEPSYGDTNEGDYNDFYDGQLRELLGGNYGRLNPKTGKREIVEIWLDGATGSGVAHQTYDFARYVNTVRELQPNCLTWMTLEAAKNYSGNTSEFPVDAFWVGNEKGYVNDPVWLKIAVNGSQVSNYEPNGQYMSIPEADVSIRPGWFYHSAQDASVKSLDYLINNIYLRSVGMGIPLLLNVPPNRDGKFHENDSVALMEFGKALKNTFANNLITSDMNVTASSVRGDGETYGAQKTIDGNYDTYWTMQDGQKTGSITIDLGKEVELDVIRLQEYIPLGQRIAGWKIEVEVYGTWREFGVGKTIGYQRIVKGELLPVRKIRLSITNSQAVPLINSIEAYHSDSSITTLGAVPPGIKSYSGKELIEVKSKKVSKLKFELLQHPAGSWPTIAEMHFYDNATGELVQLDRKNITVSATSEAKKYTGEAPSLALNTIDDNLTTIWQPEWYPSKVGMPQSLLYEFAEPVNISHLSLEARKTNKDMPTKFNIYTAEKAVDEPQLSLSNAVFDANVNIVHFTPIIETDWEELNKFSELGTAIRSKKDEAVVNFTITGNWFRLIGAKSPSTGILEVWSNGSKVATIDTYAEIEQKDRVLYEGSLEGMKEHVVQVRVTGRKNDKATNSKIILQQVYQLEKNVKSMFEFSKPFSETKENAQMLKLKVHRYGNLKEPANVTFITTPGTGVHGKTYKDKTEVVHFAIGESQKEISIVIVDNTLAEGNKDFYVELNNPTVDNILGFNSVMRVLVYDNDSNNEENAELNGYCEPAGTQHVEKKAFLVSASTTGAKKNLNYSASEIPSTVYVKFLEDRIEAARNSTFTLKLNANKAGEASEIDVYQDFRYNYATVYVDWNGDLNFSEDEKIATYGKKPPIHNVLGNYNEIMEINQEIKVPDFAILQNIPIRVIYQNAWKSLENGACSNITEGMVYDFKLLVKEAIAGVKDVVKLFNVFFDKNTETIKCIGDFTNITKVSVFNMEGLKVKDVVLRKGDTNIQIPVNDLLRGVYLVAINNNETRETYKILK